MTDQLKKSSMIVNCNLEILSGTLIRQRYLVQRILGQGGCGRTYLALDQQRFDKPCVLKEFFPSNTREDVVTKSKELFEREARVLNNLQHPQIPQFFGWFEEDSRLFLVQDFINGQTYANLLQQGKTLSESEIIQFFQNLLPVLEYIHSHKIIHRDISPDNIMLPHNQDKPILIDFGVVNQQDSDLTNLSDFPVTSGTTVGKVGYSPVEQITLGQCYPSSDLYALGVTAIVLLTGKPPQSLLVDNGNRWIWQQYVTVTNELKIIIDKMLQNNPQERYQSAQAILAELNSQPNITNQNLQIATTLITESSGRQNYEAAAMVQTIPVAPSLSSNTANSSSQRKFQPIVYFYILLAIAGITFLGIKSSEIKGICDVFNNCKQEPLWPSS